jgi:thioredoxin-related protein
MKNNLFLSLFFIFLFLSACSGQESEQLTRVDVQIVDNYQTDIMITDHETISMLENLFKKVVWEPGVEAEMSRKEDVLITLFYRFDKNMPERLYTYRIWFNEDETATVISDNEIDRYGTLNKEETEKLKKL